MIYLIVIGWILSGLLAVYLGGVVDKMSGVIGAAPILLLFLTGPIGLSLATVCFILERYQLNFLLVIYNKGNKRE